MRRALTKHLIFWGGLLLLCAGIRGAEWWENRLNESSWAARNAADQTQLYANLAIFKAVRPIIDAEMSKLSADHLVLPDYDQTGALTRHLGQLSPLDFGKEVSGFDVIRTRATLRDLQTGGCTNLLFNNGRWSAAEMVVPRSSMPPNDFSVRSRGVLIRMIAYYAWWIVFPLGIVTSRAKYTWATLSLWLAMFCVLSTFDGFSKSGSSGWLGRYPDRSGLTILMIPVSLLLIRHIQRGKRATNPMLCRTCQYDLHTNISGTCPECGSMIPSDQWAHISGLATNSDDQRSSLSNHRSLNL